MPSHTAARRRPHPSAGRRALRRGAAACVAAPLVAHVASAQPASARPAPARPAAARREVAVEFAGGTAWSWRTPLTTRLPGAGAATLRARYATRPLRDAPYYAYRVGYGTPARGVEAELVHHKLYLENPRPPVERFEVTHGYNLATANLRAPAARYVVRVGLGLVVAHPEGRVAGRAVGPVRSRLGGGYHVAGATAQLGVGRRYPLGTGAVAAFAAPELKLTASGARVPLAGGGSVLVPNVAVHALAGLGVRRRW
jgi:hypothetical protein